MASILSIKGISSIKGITRIGPPPAEDPDALAFITAAGITNPAQQDALETLVTDLKQFGVWSKFIAIYPFIGGTANSHKYNLKDPRDLDEAYRIVFAGNVVHSSTGVKFNDGGYGDTKLIPALTMPVASAHMALYSRTATGIAGVDAGVGYFNNPNGRYEGVLSMHIHFTDSINYNDIWEYTAAGGRAVSSVQANGLGMYVASRTSLSLNTTYKNGVQIGSNTNTLAADFFRPTYSIYVGAQRYLDFTNSIDRPQNYSLREFALFSLGTGLSASEASNFDTAVGEYQATLNRAV